MGNNGYPDNWPEIAYRIKEKAGWCCEHCTHPHDPKNGYSLGVHHCDHDKSNCADYNLIALCQRCHLHFENIPLYILLNQLSLWDDFEVRWLKKYRAGQRGKERTKEKEKTETDKDKDKE